MLATLLAVDNELYTIMAEKNKDPLEEEKELFKLSWMLRPCDVYENEYSECTSIKGRFHQYFIHGETVDCSAWISDFKSCTRWLEERDFKAYKDLLESEKKRRNERLSAHYRNNVWRKRVGPPADWDKPLPAWLEEENKHTYLAVKAEEIKNKGVPTEGERSFCVIS